MTSNRYPRPTVPSLDSLLRIRTAGFEIPSLEDLLGKGPERTERVTRSAPGGSGTAVRVSNVNGDVTVLPADGDEVTVEAVKRTRGDRSKLATATVEVRHEDGLVTVSVDHDDDGIQFGQGVSVELTVRIPVEAALDRVETTNGAVRVRDVAGDARVESVNGEVTVESVDGVLDLETSNGSVTARDVRAIRRAESTNGSLDLSVRSIDGDLTAETTNGSATLRLPADVDAEVGLESTLGTVSVDRFDLADATVGRRSVAGRLGAGGPRIGVETLTGSITLERLDAARGEVESTVVGSR